jgi:GH24 family phage-related lysozyme (muramidase)
MHNIIKLNNKLNKRFKIYSKLNPNQKTALISFSYNLGADFIDLETKKLKRTFRCTAVLMKHRMKC